MNHQHRPFGAALLGMGVLLWIAGCGTTKPNAPEGEGSNSKNSTDAGAAHGDTSGLPEGLFVKTAPENPITIAKAKEVAKEGEEIIIRARIGGTEKPFTEGAALFTVCDLELTACTERTGDNCETPWDMCCEPEVRQRSAAIQISDKDGRPLKIDLTGKNDLLPLSVLVVKGKVGPRPDKNALLIDAQQIFVEKKGMVPKQE